MSVLANSLKAESLELCLLDLKGKRLEVVRKLYNTYLTRADLHRATGIRISTLCSTLKRLEDEGWVRVAFDTMDPETNRNVSCYTTTATADVRVDFALGKVLEHWQGAA